MLIETEIKAMEAASKMGLYRNIRDQRIGTPEVERLARSMMSLYNNKRGKHLQTNKSNSQFNSLQPGSKAGTKKSAG